MDFNLFRTKVMQHFGLDLHSYKETQLRRRLDSYLNRLGVHDYASFLQMLISNREAYEKFLDYLTINVSEFFRDPERFKDLERMVLPALLRERNSLKIWSAACANGAEPYSIAIILDELTPGRVHSIEATDIDKNILEVAVAGRYASDAVRNVSNERLRKYFNRDAQGYYLIKDEIKRRVRFRRHDLLKDPYGSGYDLIVCRNVTIYFTREAQDRVNAKFAQALTPGGYLFIGGSEMIFNYHELGFEKVAPCFYRKRR